MTYKPPAASLSRLGSITTILAQSTKVDAQFTKGGKAIFLLPGKQLYYESLLDLDSDGSSFATQDKTGDAETSLHQPDGKPVDSDAVPYFVMPQQFAKQYCIVLGDVAAVVYKDKVEFAVFADHGPKDKLGEGSIALHRSLGHEVIEDGKLHDVAIDKDAITIVFPGSGNGSPQSPDKIRQIGRDLFAKLGGKIAS
jgi:hypothetical protein